MQLLTRSSDERRRGVVVLVIVLASFTLAIPISSCGLFGPESEEVTVNVTSYRGAGTWSGDGRVP